MEFLQKAHQQDSQLRHQVCPICRQLGLHGQLQTLQKVSLIEFRDVLERLMEQTKTKGYSFQMEILVRAKRMGLKIE